MRELVSGWRKVLAFTDSAKSKAAVSSQSSKTIYYTSAGLACLLLAFVMMLSYQNWQQHKEDTKAELETIQEVGANAVDTYFRQFEEAMLNLVELLNDDADINSSPFKNKAEYQIKRFHSFHRELRNVFVVRADGLSLAAAEKPAGIPLATIGATDSFKEFLRTGHKNFDVGRPMVDPYFKEWVIAIRIGINDEDSNLRYFVGASLPVNFLARLWKDAPITKKAPLGIMRNDGFLVSRYPNMISISDKQLYETPRKGALLDYLNRNQTAKKGFVEGKNSVENSSTLFAFRRLNNYPLTFFAALPMSEVWSSWRSKMQATYLLSAALLLGGGVVVWIFIARQKAHDDSLENELCNSSRLRNELDIAMNSMVQGLCMFNGEQRLIVCNKRYAEIYGLTEELTKPGTTLREILQHRIAAGNSPDDSESHIEERIATAATGVSGNTIHRLSDGRYIAVMHQPMADGGWVTTHEDITDRKRSEAKVEYMARHDALTGLGNRAILMEKIEEASARCRRRGETFSLLMMDLDQFKQVNDTLGHSAGDALLQEVASRLKLCLRETDIPARLGGDEFAIVQAAESDQLAASTTVADRIIAELRKPFSLEDGLVHIGVSVGIALAPEHSTNPDDLMKMADMALYQAKGSGRNCYRVFGPEMTEAMNTRHELENDLRRAIENDELRLHYQPIIDTKTLKMCGAEALIRWQHPTKGMIPPDRFIPLAEEVGLMSEIGGWVLHTACFEAMNWPADVKIAINLSAKQFGDGNLADIVMYVLAETGLPPERLELEITETALIESAMEVLPVLRKFKNLGISIALDDFGTGYSSLSQLTVFPFDKIKIDKSFTQNMIKRADCAAIISATMTLAQSLNKQTTAEGVETADQYRLLRLAGVTSLQGYLFKRPGPASELDFEGVYGKLALESAA